MKNLITYLKTLWGAWGNLQSKDISLDRRLTVGSPSGLDAKLQLNTFVRFAATLVLVLTIGVGNVWGDTYTKVTSLEGVTTGDYVIIGCKTASSFGILTYGTINDGRISYSESYTSYASLPSTITDPADASVFTLTVSTSGEIKYVTIYNVKNSKYIKNSAATFNGKFAWDSSTPLTFTIEYNSGTYGTIRMYAGSTYYLGVNSSANWWRGYASSTLTATNGLTLYKKASSCANKVTLTKGSTTNGTFDLDKANGEHDNCDANFVVHVSNIVPADGSKYCNGIEATGGNSTVTGPVEGVWTVTYTKGNNITSTITPTYATKTSYTVTWYNEGASIGTESVYSGDKVSALPSPAPTSSCSGEFIGWVRSDAAVADKSVTDAYTTQPTAPTLFTDVAGSPTITGNTAFHAVYRMPKPD